MHRTQEDTEEDSAGGIQVVFVFCLGDGLGSDAPGWGRRVSLRGNRSRLRWPVRIVVVGMFVEPIPRHDKGICVYYCLSPPNGRIHESVISL